MTKSHIFSGIARLLHWTIAAMILAMLFIGIGMVSSQDLYHTLLSIHRPLGIAILLLAAVRLIYRLFNPPPALPQAMPRWLKLLADLSHIALYAFMFAVPLVGWAMLSAGGYPIVLYGGLRLPAVLPLDLPLYAALRTTHTALAMLLLLTFLAHLGAALLHALVFRDGVFQSMATLRSRRTTPSSTDGATQLERR
ncbi:cytochrome b [Paraburkholderia sp. J41]|uniref:cytochrome b n=1 Tax=Paraburkholderia sp. J41 TaxID=2805433 RepID=UPI002AC35E78|nr:cytochrome b [Paraburkholderia sp. J41]